MYDLWIEQRIDEEIANFLEREYAVQGEELYQWYRTRFLAKNNKFLTRSIGLAHYDKAIVRFVLEKCPNATRFVEVGAGVAQECMLIAAHGMAAYAVETTHAQLDMLERLKERLTIRVDRSLSCRVNVIRDFYPKRAEEYVHRDTILVFPTLSWGLSEEEEAAIIDSMRLASGVIFSEEHFFRPRTAEEKTKLIDSVRQKGFAAPVEVISWRDWESGFAPNTLFYMARQ